MKYNRHSTLKSNRAKPGTNVVAFGAAIWSQCKRAAVSNDPLDESLCVCRRETNREILLDLIEVRRAPGVKITS